MKATLDSYRLWRVKLPTGRVIGDCTCHYGALDCLVQFENRHVLVPSQSGRGLVPDPEMLERYSHPEASRTT